MTSTDQCEDCGQPATVSMAFMGANRPGKSNTSHQHRYCRPCAERRGVPKRESLPPKRRDGEGAKWDGLLQFYRFMEKHSLSEPEQRASAREAALQFRGFLDKAAHRDPPPAELREVTDRIIKNTA